MSDFDDRISDIVRLLEKEGALGERFKGKHGSDEIRFGSHGSLSVIVRGSSRGNWFDHEADDGGGPWQLIQRTHDNPLLWLKDKGFVSDADEQTYDYTDETGRLLFQVVRRPGHKFLQRRPDPAGQDGWNWKLGDTRRVLYHLPELIAAKGQRIYLAEGEKDADRLRSDWGVTATTNPGGAKYWRTEYNQYFAGAEIILLEDNDDAGRERSAKLAPQLARVATVRVIRFPSLPEKGDISDWMNAGGSQSTLEDIIDSTEPWQSGEAPEPPKPNGHDKEWVEPPTPWLYPEDPWEPLILSTLQTVRVPRREWLVYDWLPKLETTGFSGAGGQGKTLAALQLATAAALGRHWFGIPLQPTKVFALLCEDRQDDVHIRQINVNREYGCDFTELDNLVVYPRRSHPRNRLMYFDRDRIGHLTVFFHQFLREVKALGSQIVILDTRSDLFFGDQNDEEQARTFVRQCLDVIAETISGAVLLLYQPSYAGRKGTGESGSVQWDSAFRARWYLEDREDEDEPYARVLTRVKSNHSSRDEKIELKWEGGILIRTDQPVLSGFDAAALDRKAERVFMQLMTLMWRDKVRVTNNPAASRSFAPTVFAKHPEREGVTGKLFDRAMRAMIHQGKIKVVEAKPGTTYLAMTNGHA